MTKPACAYCGESLAGKRPNARYCSDDHRVLAWHRRNGRKVRPDAHDAPAAPTRPHPCRCEKPVGELDDGEWRCVWCARRIEPAS